MEDTAEDLAVEVALAADTAEGTEAFMAEAFTEVRTDRDTTVAAVVCFFRFIWEAGA